MGTLFRSAREWTITVGRTVAQQGTAGATNKRMTRVLHEDLRTFGGFTHDFSCNGSVAGTKGDGVVRWAADSDIIGDTPGNAHSWSVEIHSVLGSVLTDKDSNSDGGGGAPGSVYWSPSAGFTGGSTTARPTATDEIEITTSTQMWNTTNGSYTYHLWRCVQSGREGVRIACIHSTNANGPDNLINFEVAASVPAAWSPATVARFRSGGAGSAADRGNWTAAGWAARVSGTTRTPLLTGDTPPASTDVDGDRLLVPAGLNDATVGRLGFLEDWHFVTDAVTNLATFSDTDGVGGWIVLDEIVWPWNGTDPGGGNIAGAKLLVNYQTVSDDVAPVVTAITPVGVLPGTREQAMRASITFNVTDDDPGVVSNPILVYTRDGRFEALYVAQLGGFVNGYTGTTAAITDGTQITVNAPTDGWWDDVRFYQWPVDGAGNVTA